MAAMAEIACAAPLRAFLYWDASEDKANVLMAVFVSAGKFTHRSLNNGSYEEMVDSIVTFDRIVCLNNMDPSKRACSGLVSSANIWPRWHINPVYARDYE